MTCTTDTCGTGGWTGPLPGDPDNNVILTASPAFGGIDVAWTYPAVNPEAVAFVQLFRGVVNTFAQAIQIATVGGGSFYDKSTTEQPITYFYWIKVVSVNGTVGEVVGPASAVARPTIERVLEGIAGKIETGALAGSLRTEIDKITLNYSELVGEINARIAANSALSNALAQVQSGVEQSLAFIGQEIIQRQEGDSAIVGQVNTIAAANAANLALLQTSYYTKVDADTAVALATQDLASKSGLKSAVDAAKDAQDDADTANSALTNIASDSILSPSEKPAVMQDYAVITSEQAGIVAQATSYGITTEKTAYETAVTALTTYLDTLTGWNTVPGVDVVIDGATFRSTFATVYTTRQTVLNAITAKAKSLIGTAQEAADAAIDSADTANLALADIASDALLTASEKPRVIQEYGILLAEKDGLVAQAVAIDHPSTTTAKNAYVTSLASLTDYLAGLTSWNVVPGFNVVIVGADFRAKFAAVYAKRQALLNEIAAVLGGRVTASAAWITQTALTKTAEDAALALTITQLQAADTDNAAAVKTVESSKIGYAALSGTSVPFDGDGTTIVYPVATYPTADFPEYAADRKRIIDKVGATNWNGTAAGALKPLTWLVGLPLASAVKAIGVTGPDGLTATLEQAFIAQQALDGKLSAQYTIKTDVGGHIAGFGLATAGNSEGVKPSWSSVTLGVLRDYQHSSGYDDLFRESFNGRLLGSVTNMGALTLTDALEISKYNAGHALTYPTSKAYIEGFLTQQLISDPVKYARYLVQDASTTSEFAIRADRFSIAPGTVASAVAPTVDLFNGYAWLDTSVAPAVTRYWHATSLSWSTTPTMLPFVVLAAPDVINGVDVPAGVYIDSAVIRELSVTKLTAGVVGGDIASLSYPATAGWQLRRDGSAEFSNVKVRGDVQATSLNAATGTFSGTLMAGVLNPSEMVGDTFTYATPGNYPVSTLTYAATVRFTICGGGGGGAGGRGGTNDRTDYSGYAGTPAGTITMSIINVPIGTVITTVVGAAGVGGVAGALGGNGGVTGIFMVYNGVTTAYYAAGGTGGDIFRSNDNPDSGLSGVAPERTDHHLFKISDNFDGGGGRSGQFALPASISGSTGGLGGFYGKEEVTYWGGINATRQSELNGAPGVRGGGGGGGMATRFRVFSRGSLIGYRSVISGNTTGNPESNGGNGGSGYAQIEVINPNAVVLTSTFQNQIERVNQSFTLMETFGSTYTGAVLFKRTGAAALWSNDARGVLRNLQNTLLRVINYSTTRKLRVHVQMEWVANSDDYWYLQVRGNNTVLFESPTHTSPRFGTGTLWDVGDVDIQPNSTMELTPWATVISGSGGDEINLNFFSISYVGFVE